MNGDKVFSVLTSVQNEEVKVFVSEWEVLDAANRVVRGLSGVRVLPEWETLHECEQEAWERAAKEFVAVANAVQAKARECLQKAAAAGVVRVTA